MVADSRDTTQDIAKADQAGRGGEASVPSGMRPLHSELPPHCYVSVHAELRVPGTDAWTSGCATAQPFKSVVDPDVRAVYWHKDMFDDFYGEIWVYDEHVISLRQETFPHWPAPFDPANAPWDVRPGKFRLFSDGAPQGLSRLPGGRGRVLAPTAFTDSARWSHRGNMSTYLCRDWNDFAHGNCSLYQPDFLDTRVTVRRIAAPFSSAFDGAIANDTTGEWAVHPVMTDLRDTWVINQEMAGCQGGRTTGRERFFFASARNGSNLGIVRWDASVPNASSADGWTVTARTVGLKIECDNRFNNSGFPGRRAHDVVK